MPVVLSSKPSGEKKLHVSHVYMICDHVHLCHLYHQCTPGKKGGTVDIQVKEAWTLHVRVL